MFIPLETNEGVNYDVHIEFNEYFDLDGTMTFSSGSIVSGFTIDNVGGKTFALGDYSDKTFYLVKEGDVDRNGLVELLDVETAFNKIIQGIDNIESYISDIDLSGIVEMEDIDGVYQDAILVNPLSTDEKIKADRAIFIEPGMFGGNAGSFYISMKIPVGETINKIKLYGIGFDATKMEIEALPDPIEIEETSVAAWTNPTYERVYSTGVIRLEYGRDAIAETPEQFSIIGNGSVKKIFKINYELKSGQSLPAVVNLEKIADSIYLEGSEFEGEVTDLYTIYNGVELTN